jgi:cation transport regulator ChaB
MGAINAIAQAGPSIVAQTLPALINGMNPMSALNSAAGAFGKAAMDGASNAPGAPPLAGALIGAAAGQAAVNGGSALAQTDATPPTDPAYSAAPLLAPFLNDMYSYLTSGPKDGIDWAKFKDSKKDEDGKVQQAHGLTWLLTNVKQQEKSAQLGTSEPSEKLKKSFALMIKTIESIKAEVLKSSDMAAGSTDAATIKTWQEDIKNAKAIALELETTAKTFPGSSTSTPQMRTLKIDVPKTDYSAQNAALNTATEKLAINQRALNAAQENYQKAADSALKVQQELTAIQTKLKGLEVEGQTLEKVKDILIDCIATLVQLKVQISKLKSFFGALSTMVRLVVQNKVKKFDEDVSSVAVDAKKKQILRLTDMDIEIIYSSTLQIKAYFELLQTIARMYCQMHVNHVSKGMELVWDLSQVLKEPSEVAAKRDALNNWATSASQAILKTVADKQNEIKDGLEDRISNISEQTQMLEKVGVTMDQTFVAAMQTGAATVTEHVEKNLPQGLNIQVSEDISI